MNAARRALAGFAFAVAVAACGPTLDVPAASGASRSDSLSTSTGSMINSRAWYPLVTLASGLVLAPSGVYTVSGFSGASELYNPASGTWASTGQMNVGRRGHGAVRLADGRVLVSGGRGSPSGGYEATIPDEIFNPATGTWSLGPSHLARFEGATVLLNSGLVLEVGGYNPAQDLWLNAARLFDPGTNGVLPAGSMLVARSSFGSVVLNDGRVLVVGGQGATGTALSSAELFDPATASWTAAASAPHASSVGALVLAPDGSVLWNTGVSNVVDRYDPATDSWSTFATLAVARAQARAAIIGDSLYLLGGDVGAGATNTVDRVNLTTSAVTAAEPLVEARMGFAMIRLLDGRRLLASGQTAELHSVCVPTSCAALGKNCGTVSDGCGTNLNCGSCTAPEICTANVCSLCVPQTCVGAGATCGALADGCGGTLSCGVCVPGTSCQANTCVAVANNATYDATLRAPRCAAFGKSCDSVALLNGRGPLGPEPSAPNTVASSCADGTTGVYHSDESLDRLKVSTLDGSTIEGGKVIRVDATVWSYSWSSDRLDLYYAANAANPVWIFLATLAPTTNGASTLTAQYALPHTATQVVRGRFRYGGTAAACGAGPYTDHDDLVFAVADVQPPVVTWQAPAQGALVRGSQTLQVSAADNVAIARVDYFRGGALIGSSSTSPYSLAWDTSTAANGPASLTATAVDSSGISATTPVRDVVVDNEPPTIVLTAPSEGALLRSDVAVTAVAADGVGVVAVDFYDGQVLLGRVLAAPYVLSWATSAAADGPHQLRAVAFDGAGNSASHVCNVVVDNQAPAVAIVEPAEAALVHGAVQLNAAVSDAVGVVAVDYFDGTSLLGRSTVAPFGLVWSTLSAGEGAHQLRATAYDGAGNSAQSVALSVVVDNAPTVALSSPAAGSVVSRVVSLAGTAVALDGRTISQADFFVDGNLVGTDTTEPFVVSWNSRSVANGAHDITLRATDTAGFMRTSPPISVTSGNDFEPPTISLSSPANGAVYGQELVVVTATASDNVGVVRVDFFDGATLIASDAEEPFTASWSTIGLSGQRLLTSVAFDEVGNSTTSSAATVRVLAAQLASYDGVLRAPKCATLAASCDTGATLVLGRGPLGPEPNVPNTVGATCGDGTSGTFHGSGESVDRLSIAPVQGGGLTPGNVVRVSAVIWAKSTSDRLDVFRAASATSPSWVLVGTLTPTVFNAPSTLHVTYTLPAGTTQAVRASLRRNGSAVSCPSGGYNDRDDLVFATQ